MDSATSNDPMRNNQTIKRTRPKRGTVGWFFEAIVCHPLSSVVLSDETAVSTSPSASLASEYISGGLGCLLGRVWNYRRENYGEGLLKSLSWSEGAPARAVSRYETWTGESRKPSSRQERLEITHQAGRDKIFPKIDSFVSQRIDEIDGCGMIDRPRAGSGGRGRRSSDMIGHPNRTQCRVVANQKMQLVQQVMHLREMIRRGLIVACWISTDGKDAHLLTGTAQFYQGKMQFIRDERADIWAVGREKGQDHGMSAKLGERNRLAELIGQTKIGRRSVPQIGPPAKLARHLW